MRPHPMAAGATAAIGDVAGRRGWRCRRPDHRTNAAADDSADRGTWLAGGETADQRAAAGADQAAADRALAGIIGVGACGDS